ncbi:MAG: hypothetical protein ACM3ZB_04515 [bacterium]|jgi:hypothetical protein
MIPALIVSPDAAYSGELESELAAIGGVAVVRRLQSYPAEHEFVRVIRAHGPPIRRSSPAAGSLTKRFSSRSCARACASM